MTSLNKHNPKKGADFEILATFALEKRYGMEFFPRSILIGRPKKGHNFDLASEKLDIVVECKCYTWTSSGNAPSAKLAMLNEAILYLSYLPTKTKKLIVMRRNLHPTTKVSLASYYKKRFGHLFKDITLLELNTDSKILKEI
ncbi:MAG: hypothetical protein KAS32_11975 [Candidatus Peribacteraceae bacterium]|nr:hypothetical protein [Candidatus Peribacteraceae bacterium]